MEQLDPRRALALRAGRAYESGRLRHAVFAAWPVLLAAVLAFRLGCSVAWVATLGAVLLAAVVAFRWRGEEFGRGVSPGLLAGIAPLLAPALTVNCVSGCAPSCSTDCALWCQVSCVAGGLVAGTLVGFRAARFGSGWPRFLLAGTIVAAFTGSMGCLLGGAIGVAGMSAGFVVGAIPVLTLLPRPADG